jgi:plastocyanin
LIKRTFILPVLAVAAIAAGCGSGSSTSASTYGEPTAAATGTAAPAKTAAPAGNSAAQAPASGSNGAQKAGAISVDIANFAFAPKTIEAKVGQTITFTNQDSTPHTATATEGATFDSGELDQGKSFSYTAKKAGTIKFVCSFHPNMTGTITVS